jgi:hypothetical protein
MCLHWVGTLLLLAAFRISLCGQRLLAELAYRLIAFEARYKTAARPFDWRFTHKGLNRLLTRIAE